MFLAGQLDTSGGSSSVRTSLLSGPLHGKILPSESSWAIIRSPLRPPYADEAAVSVEFATSGVGSGSAVGNCYLLLSLPKAHGNCDIWATVLDRDYLRELKLTVSVDNEDEDVGNYGKHYQ